MPIPATSAQVRPTIQLRGGKYGDQPRVPFYTGGVTKYGSPKVALRKPEQRNWRGKSVWVVRYGGWAALVDPVDINGTTVFNIAYSV